MINPVNLISEMLQNIPNPRTKEVIARRFGLKDGQRHTLEAIGRDYKITRERVRQIEESGLAVLRQEKMAAKFKPVLDLLDQHLAEYGDFKREDSLFNDLNFVCFPAKEIERLRRENPVELNRCHAAFYLIMALGRRFEKIPESDHFYTAWAGNKDSFKKAKKTVDSAVKFLDSKKTVLKDFELVQALKGIHPELPEKAIFSYIDASKNIERNHLGQYGMAKWPEISPKGVKDKAYIILKSAGRPMHFSEVTNMINKSIPSSRPAYVQTVHNELIKDSRFILVGRGLYALAEWGYQPGTVLETISEILKKEGPLPKQEILKKVLEKRMVKENTVLINLQNKKFFERNQEGKYSLKA